MPEDTQTAGGAENQSEPNISGAGPDGRGPGRTTDEGPGEESRSFQTRPGDVEPVSEPEDGAVGFGRYDPSAVESTRVRMQGGGMGQRDLDQQGDPASVADPAAGADAAENDMSQTPDPQNARS